VERVTGQPLSIDVVSDVVCPWCYLGKRRLESALTQTPEIDVTIRWKPFRLDATIPPEGIPRRVYLERKFGSVEGIQPMHDRLAEFGKAEGIDFRFDRIERSPNTVAAHRLVRWAEHDGAADAVVEALFRAYFTEGRDIGDADVLADVAATAGLDPDRVKERLASGEDQAEVEAEVVSAYRIGVTGVPCFIVDRRYAIIGAQEASTLAGALTDIAAARAA
jgi:predicted DsbA family dithiol-disulfide isomerase